MTVMLQARCTYVCLRCTRYPGNSVAYVLNASSPYNIALTQQHRAANGKHRRCCKLPGKFVISSSQKAFIT